MLSNIEIGKKLKRRREELGLTLKQVADKVGVATSTIQRYESGYINEIKLPVLKTISNILKLNFDWVIGKSNNRLEIKKTDVSSLKKNNNVKNIKQINPTKMSIQEINNFFKSLNVKKAIFLCKSDDNQSIKCIELTDEQYEKFSKILDFLDE